MNLLRATAAALPAALQHVLALGIGLQRSRPKLMRNQLSSYRGFPVTISCAGGPSCGCGAAGS